LLFYNFPIFTISDTLLGVVLRIDLGKEYTGGSESEVETLVKGLATEYFFIFLRITSISGSHAPAF
jgi:hypothetical protein